MLRSVTAFSNAITVVQDAVDSSALSAESHLKSLLEARDAFRREINDRLAANEGFREEHIRAIEGVALSARRATVGLQLSILKIE